MDLVLAKLDRIEKRLEAIENGCAKMNDHVNFVERAYKVVRDPLNYVLTHLKRAEELPALENKTLLNDKEE
jgi:hypothetical protein